MILQEESLELALAMYFTNRKPTQLSGFILVELGGIEPPSKQGIK